jgi:hypothetical protein
MSTPTSHVSTYSRYIGRVGALAAALGIGMAVVTSPGLASADTTDSSSPSTEDANAGTTSTGTASSGTTSTGTTGTSVGSSTVSASTTTDSTTAPTTDTATSSAGSTSSSIEVAPGVTVSSSGGAQTGSTPSDASTAPSTVEVAPTTSEATPSTETTQPAQTASSTTPTALPPGATSAGTDSNSGHTASINASTSSPTSSTAETSLAVTNVVSPETQPAATVADSSVAPTARTLFASNASDVLTTGAADALVAPTVQATNPVVGVVGFFNAIVTNLLNPFLAPTPDTPDPFTPVVWAVLAWVRRNVFNEAPIINNPVATMQTGQTVTGIIATDPEGDALTYTVTQGPEHGTLTIDQATNTFTYVPDDIDYDDPQTDSFTVSVTDGKTNLLSLFGVPHSDEETVSVTVQPPMVERVIVNLPPGYINPNTPRFAADGESLYFAVTPPGGTRMEIHQINVDGTGLTCVTCGLSPNITANLTRVAPGGNGLLAIQVATSPNSYVIYEPVTNQLVPVETPPSAARALDPQREMRISPDGTHVVFSQIQLGQTGNFTAVPVVGRLVRTTDAVTGAPEYHIEDARVVFPVGEAKQWTLDGKGVIITGGQYEMGNVDDIVVDLATGEVTRLTYNLDYDEDIDMSPNGQWIAVGSPRTYDALTPMTRIVRPAFLPAQIQGAVYEAYAGANSTNVSNQEWAVAIEDEREGENGIPLFVDDDPATPGVDEGDNYNARSMASWNEDGTAVAFWEAQAAPLGSPDPNVSRLVIANLKYTTSVGPVEGDLVTPHPTWAPKLSESVPTTVALPPLGTYAGAGGGTATITEVPDPTNPAATLRTVTYDNYVNVDGLILSGTESTSATASQNTIRYRADLTVTGTQTGYLRGDVTINKLTRTITPTVAPLNPASKTGTAADPGSQIRSSLDGDLLVLLDPNRIAETRDNA